MATALICTVGGTSLAVLSLKPDGARETEGARTVLSIDHSRDSFTLRDRNDGHPVSALE